MIEDLHVHEPKSFLEVPGEQLVGLAWLRRPGGVVVGKDHGGRVDGERGFDDFEDYFNTSLLGTTVGLKVAAMADAEREKLKARVRPRVPAGPSGGVTPTARANAIKGRVPR